MLHIIKKNNSVLMISFNYICQLTKKCIFCKVFISIHLENKQNRKILNNKKRREGINSLNQSGNNKKSVKLLLKGFGSFSGHRGLKCFVFTENPFTNGQDETSVYKHPSVAV